LNQGKENRRLKPPTSLSRTQFHRTNLSDVKKKKGWKPFSSKKYKIQWETKKMVSS
jgi:hypothetical protein